jgi:hypothetical protein
MFPNVFLQHYNNFKFLLLNFFNNTAPFIPAFSAMHRKAKIAREIIIAPLVHLLLNYFFAHVTRFSDK